MHLYERHLESFNLPMFHNSSIVNIKVKQHFYDCSFSVLCFALQLILMTVVLRVMVSFLFQLKQSDVGRRGV